MAARTTRAKRRKRVVIADNDSEWIALVSLDLELEGHDVVARCSSGQQALEACVSLSPDVLVVDHRMPPGLSGLSVAQLVTEQHPDIAVIVFTNYEDPALAQAVTDAGALYVLKSSLRALRHAVAQA